MLTYSIGSLDHSRRLESFLRTIMPDASAGYLRKLIKSGAVRLNNDAATPDSFLAYSDTVTLKESGVTLKLLASERPLLDILYENDQIIAVNKPSGLPMHRTAGPEANLVDDGMAFMTSRGTPCKLYPVNRLDKGTSGVVIMAKSSTSAGIYGRQVKEAGLDKRYLALVGGVPEKSGMIDAPLDGKASETRYRILLSGRGAALLAVTPISGRLHQIRRHLELVGHPVLGDKRYGGGLLPELTGFALHSFRTSFALPCGGTQVVCAPLPEPLLAFAAQRTGADAGSILACIYACVPAGLPD